MAATATVTALVTTTVYTSGTPSSTVRATPQGGILEGGNPSHYDPKNPIILFIIQASLVLILTRILHFPLSKFRQPRVIAEVLVGILLGPSVMGRIPGFTATIFPTSSMPAFSLAANIGLVLFLFLVGLEVDLRFLASNWRIALSVGAAGMALPFGLGCAIAFGLYRQFHNEAGLAPISFGVFMLFIGVATAITAFPVLCRILTSLKLLHTPVGVIVLSAGVANDVVGWILLALCVALVNSSTSLTALYIFLVAVGYVLFLVYLVRPAFLYILRRTGSLANGPTQSVVALTVLMVFASAFFTGVIGIHPIFGAFMIGLLLPHEGGFAISLTEKLEDLVSVLFLPLYFALSGLSTNLGLLNNGITWAYVIGVIAVAFFGKVIGGTLAGRLNGLVWRESLTIGSLMSCKGLVELIVLNIGLQAKILNTRTFTIFVVMALFTTVLTTPLTCWLYPPWYQRKLELWKAGKIDWDGNPIPEDEVSEDENSPKDGDAEVTRRILVYLRLDGLPSLFTFATLLGGTHPNNPALSVHDNEQKQDDKSKSINDPYAALTVAPSLSNRPILTIHALRLLELTERDSSVMKVTELESFATHDPILKAFRTFAHSHNISRVGTEIAVVPTHSFGSTLVGRALDLHSDLVVLPWSETGEMSETSASLFNGKPGDLLANREYGDLVADVFDRAQTVVGMGVWIDKTVIDRDDESAGGPSNGEPSTRQLSRTVTGFSAHSARHDFALPGISTSSGKYSILIPYGGSTNDLFAVRLGLQLVQNDKVSLCVLDTRAWKEPRQPGSSVASIDGHEFEQLRSRSSDRVIFEHLHVTAEGDEAAISSVSEALVRRLHETDNDNERIVIIGRNETVISSNLHHTDETRVFGVDAAALLGQLKQATKSGASVLVVQARAEVQEGALKLERKGSGGFED